MATKSQDLHEILRTLDSLQSRVQELTTAEAAAGAAPATEDPDGPPGALPAVAPLPGARGEIGPDAMSLLRAGMSELATISQFKDFPTFFVRLANRTGLRLILLKRWTTGLQVFLEENIALPPEARKKRPDGRAPIPTTKTDIFEATAQEAAIYCGPVPVKHFPLDLTLMLGRGSRDRQIIILPLPSQGHWNTFLYLDADQTTEKFLAVAEVLAQYALVRMLLLGKGVRSRHGVVAGILKAELYRRQKSQALRAGKGPQPPGEVLADQPQPWDIESTDDENEVTSLPQGGPVVENSDLDIDPFAVRPDRAAAAEVGEDASPVKQKRPLAPLEAQPPRARRHRGVTASTAADLPEVPDWDPRDNAGHTLTPGDILHHSGELPALPKAACHIMAVIEDPRTTATKLEAALAMDQALTAKVLRIANSPFYGAVREIKTVSEAIVRLGFVAIRNWTLVTAARSVFLAPGAGMLYQKIWQQSVMSAMAGQLVAQVAGRPDPEAVFIGGLMQNIGQLVLARSHPELFQEILGESASSRRPYHEVETEVLGFDHGALGALLIKEWNLSQDLEEAVRWHHNFADPEARNARVAAMIALGEEIALTSSGQEPEEGAEGDVEAPVEPHSEAARFLGITPARLTELRAKAKQLQIDPHFFS